MLGNPAQKLRGALNLKRQSFNLSDLVLMSNPQVESEEIRLMEVSLALCAIQLIKTGMGDAKNRNAEAF